MQKKKDKIYQSILVVAREAFLESGYKNTSMRAISKKSGIGLSNIYNYFKNKDELFKAVLAPLISHIDCLYEQHTGEEYLSLELFYSKDYQRESIETMVSLVRNFRNELRLLLFHAYGSSLENFRDVYSEKYTVVSIEFLKNIKAKYPEVNTSISPFFMHTLSSWMFTTIGEIVSHDELTEEEISEFMSNYINFGTAGWKKLLGV